MHKRYYIKKEGGGYLSGMGGDPRLFDTLESAKAAAARRENLYVLEYSPNILHLDCIEHLEDMGYSFEVSGDRMYVTLDTLMTGPITQELKWLTEGEHHLNRDFGEMVQFQYERTHCNFEDVSIEYSWKILCRS